MANNINSAVMMHRQFGAGQQRLRGVTTPTYSAQTVGKDQSTSSLSQALSGFINATVDATKAYDDYRTKEGEKQADKILSTIPIQQIGQLRRDGTLLAQDDPYTMRALAFKLGRSEAYNVDSEVSQKIKEFKNRDEMEAFRKTLLSERRNKMAQAYGFSPSDEMWGKGFDSDIEKRNIALYGQQAQATDERVRNLNRFAVNDETKGLIEDPYIRGAGLSADAVIGSINQNAELGLISTDAELAQALSHVMDTAANTAGGAQVIEDLQDKTVKLSDGSVHKVSSFFSKEQMNAYAVRAAENNFNLNYQKNMQFVQDVHSAVITGGLEGYHKLQAMVMDLESTGDQPSKEMTQQRDALLRAMNMVQSQMAQDTAQRQKKLAKQETDAAQANLWIQRYQEASAKPDSVWSLDPSSMPPSEYGQFTNQQMNTAQQMLISGLDDQFSQGLLSADDYSKRYMDLVRFSPKDSFAGQDFQRRVKQGIADFDKAVFVGGEYDPAEFTKLTNLYHSNPTQFEATVDPESLGKIAAVTDLQSSMGLSVSQIANLKKSAGKLDKTSQMELDRELLGTMNNSSYGIQSMTFEQQQAYRQYAAMQMGFGMDAETASRNSAQWIKSQSAPVMTKVSSGDFSWNLSKKALAVNGDVNTIPMTTSALSQIYNEASEGRKGTVPLVLKEEGDWINLIDPYTGSTIKSINSQGLYEEYLKRDKEGKNKAFSEEVSKIEKGKKAQALTSQGVVGAGYFSSLTK